MKDYYHKTIDEKIKIIDDFITYVQAEGLEELAGYLKEQRKELGHTGYLQAAIRFVLKREDAPQGEWNIYKNRIFYFEKKHYEK